VRFEAGSFSGVQLRRHERAVSSSIKTAVKIADVAFRPRPRNFGGRYLLPILSRRMVDGAFLEVLPS
jgi:hypothetical protein